MIKILGSLVAVYLIGVVVSALIMKLMASREQYSLAWADAFWESRHWFMHLVWLVVALWQYFRRKK